MGVSLETNKFANHQRMVPAEYGDLAMKSQEDEGQSAPGLDDVYDAMARQRESADRAQALERARRSETRQIDDGKGTVWEYVLLDGEAVMLTKCETDASVLQIPDEVEGFPVRALGVSCCERLRCTQIVCPPGIVRVEQRAFWGCDKLRRLVLPHDAVGFDATCIQRCDVLEDLTLPWYLSELDGSVFDAENIKRLYLGGALDHIKPCAFEKSRLEEVFVDEANPYLKSDGKALYSKDGKVFVALCVPVDSYEVADGTEVLARKSFSSQSALQKLTLPDTIEVIEPFALARTSITRFAAPPHLKEIGEKAFYRCRKLTEVTLDGELSTLGDEAFLEAPVKSLALPSSVKEIGLLGRHHGFTFEGKDATFTIDERAPYSLDKFGGLYRSAEDGVHFVRLLNPDVEDFEIRGGTRFVDERAFIHHPSIRSVKVPEGVVEIGDGAFRDCRFLTRVELPSTLEKLGNEAFLDSGLEHLNIPAKLTRIGENALVTWGAHRDSGNPTLSDVTVDAANERFYVRSGLLCERWESGKGRIILYLGSDGIVRVPDEIVAIASYAFNGARDIRELYLSNRIKNIGTRGMHFNCFIEKIHIDLEEPYEGHESFDIYFPNVDRAPQQIALAFSGLNFIDLETIFKHHDMILVNAQSLDAREGEGLSTYDHAVRILERLKDPVYLSGVNRELCENYLREHLFDISEAIARHDDRAAFDDLLDLGFVNSDNILDVIDRVGKIQDAAMTSYLLEAKRRSFGGRSRDFDL